MDKKFLKYNLFVSLGEDCACTSYLRDCKLQFASFPFDWLTHASFEKRIELVCNNFKDFLNFNDLYNLNFEKNPDIHFDSYGNKSTDFYHYHDFAPGVPLDESYPDVKAKYDRRIKRFYREIKTAKEILFVWFSRDKKLSDEQLKSALSKLNEKFPNKKIDLLILENNFEMTNKNIEEYQISENITKYIFDNKTFCTNNPLDECMGNKELTYKIFNKYAIKLSIIKSCSIIIKKIFLNLIPSRKLRNKIRG